MMYPQHLLTYLLISNAWKQYLGQEVMTYGSLLTAHVSKLSSASFFSLLVENGS